MSTREEQQREKYFKELGQHLIGKHRQFYESQNQRHIAPDDPSAARFGRYLRAARCNSGLSETALAARAKMSVATVQSLELGLIPSGKIKPVWLNRLAVALREDVADFQLLLGQPVKPAASRWPAINWRNLLAVKTRTRPAFATLAAMLLCAVIGVGLLTHSNAPGVVKTPAPAKQPAVAAIAAPQQPATLVNVNAETRLNLVKAERQKVLLQSHQIINSGDPLAVSPDYEVRAIDLVIEPQNDVDDQIQLVYAFDFFNNPVLVLWTLTNYTPNGRFNLSNAEYGLENQVLVLPKIIEINSEDRLNMVKAEFRL
jgi:hypothetical protein